MTGRPALSTSGLVGAAFILWGLLLGLQPLSDNSFLTHLATGRLILDQGLLSTDVYSRAASGEPWVVQSWLASVLYATLARLGADALVLFHGALFGLLAAMIWRLTRPAGTLVPRIALAGAAVATGSVGWQERPFVIALALLAALLLVVVERRSSWWLVPIFAAWGNVHGSWPLGLAVLGLAITAAIAEQREPSPVPLVLSRPRSSWAGDVVAAGLGLGTMLLADPRLVVFPFELLGQNDFLGEVAEWRPPDFDSWWQWAYLAEVALVVAALVRRPRRAHWLWAAAFVGVSLLATRNIVFAAVALLPVGASGFDGLGSLRGSEGSRPTVLAGAALAAVAALGVVVAVDRPAYDLTGYPVDALAAAGSLADAAYPVRVGNLLTWSEGASASVFIDDRFDFYPDDQLADLLTLERGAPGWTEVLDARSIDTVVWRADEDLASLLADSPDWAIRWSDGQWLVAHRRQPVSPVGEQKESVRPR